jgi:hypothetical protein
VWLINTIDSALGPQILEVRNAGGDELLFCTLHFPFAAGIAKDEICYSAWGPDADRHDNSLILLTLVGSCFGADLHRFCCKSIFGLTNDNFQGR